MKVLAAKGFLGRAGMIIKSSIMDPRSPAVIKKVVPTGPASDEGLKDDEGPVVGVVSPMFKLIFITVVLLTITSAILSVVLALLPGPGNDTVKNLVETFSGTWKMGFGAIIGLIGGKAV